MRHLVVSATLAFLLGYAIHVPPRATAASDNLPSNLIPVQNRQFDRNDDDLDWQRGERDRPRRPPQQQEIDRVPESRTQRRNQDSTAAVMGSGTRNLGPSNVPGRGELRATVPLSRSYASPPRIVVTTHTEPRDFITAVVTSVGRDRFEIWAMRSNGGAWAADLRIDWIEIGQPE